MSGLRVGIAGFGLAGQVFHAPLVQSVAGLELAAIVTGDPGRRARARAAHPDALLRDRVDELWDEIELLVVATPNRAHIPLALAAVERGLPVVVDKPLAPSVAEVRRLLAAGGRVTVFQNRRWDGDFLTAARLLREDALGGALRFESRFERFRPEVRGDAWREREAVEEGGGLLLDLGVHLVDQARELFGPPRSVYAEIERRRPGARVDDDVFIALEHAGGLRSHLYMSATSAIAGPRLRLSGRTGAFEATQLDPQEAQLANGIVPGEACYGVGRGTIAREDGEARVVELERGAYERFYEGVVDWLAGNAGPPVEPLDALEVLRILEAARASAAGRTIIELEEMR